MIEYTTEQKIQSFEQLEAGWHYGDGYPPAKDTIDRALEINKCAREAGFRDTDAFPGIDGKVRVTIYYGEHYLEFNVEVNGSVTAVHEQRKEVEYTEDLTIEQTKRCIRDFARRTPEISQRTDKKCSKLK